MCRGGSRFPVPPGGSGARALQVVSTLSLKSQSLEGVRVTPRLQASSSPFGASNYIKSEYVVPKCEHLALPKRPPGPLHPDTPPSPRPGDPWHCPGPCPPRGQEGKVKGRQKPRAEGGAPRCSSWLRRPECPSHHCPHTGLPPDPPLSELGWAPAPQSA